MRKKTHGFSLYNNFLNSVSGIRQVTKSEKPLQAELMLLAFGTFCLFFIKLDLSSKIILFATLFIPIIVEFLNSAIEATVDIIVQEYHPLAKYAKDAASASVLFSLIFVALIWIAFLTKGAS